MPAPRSESFDYKRFLAVWHKLPKRIKERIRLKAEWEHMCLTAVMRDWWPELWKKVLKPEAPDASQGAGEG
jgi:hypothetical protein